MRKDLLTLLGALVGVILLALAVVTVNSGQESSANTKELALETKAVAEATNREADALYNVATAEAIGGRNELAAAGIAGDIELLRTFLPQGDNCVTTSTPKTIDVGGTPTVVTEVTSRCDPVIPSNRDVAQAVERLTGTAVPTPTLKTNCTITQDDDCRNPYPDVHEQIMPFNRLLPVTQGEPWQLLLPSTQGDIIGGYWGPPVEPEGERHVMTYTPSSDTLDWAVIGGTGGGGSGTIGDITNIIGGAGITVTGSDTHTPTVRITEGLFDKISGIEEEAEVNVQSDWDETDSSDDAYILNKPAEGTVLPAYEANEFLTSRSGDLLWEPVNQVPVTPGTSTGIGHSLTVTGENDGDFAWRETTDATARSRNAATQTEVNNNATSIEELTTGQTNLRQSVVNIVSLPTLPDAGSRDGKVAQFNDDTLEWSTVTGGSGGTDTTARQGVSDNAAAIAVNSTDIAEQDTSLGELGGKIADLERGFVFEPDYWLTSTDARTYVVHLNSGEVPDTATRIRLTIGGAQKTQNITSGDTDYSFSFTALDATNIERIVGVAARDVLRLLSATDCEADSRGGVGHLAAVQVLSLIHI